MAAPVLIVGQGIAGSMLGWACEWAGIDFEIIDAGHASAASRVAAGLVSPVTGQRFAPTWGFADGGAVARSAYAAVERALGCPLLRDLRIRRRFRRPEDADRLAERVRRAGGAVPSVSAVDADGAWIEGAWQVDLPALLAGSRARWTAAGRLREGVFAPGEPPVGGARDGVILCTGEAIRTWFPSVPWERATGEILALQTPLLDPGVVLHDGHWLLPDAPGQARIGATFVPTDAAPTASASGAAELLASARFLLGPGAQFSVTGTAAGVRLGVKDRRPVAGRDPRRPGLGVLGGLGSKGVLWAPGLARQWVNHLSEGVPFAPEIELGRWFR